MPPSALQSSNKPRCYQACLLHTACMDFGLQAYLLRDTSPSSTLRPQRCTQSQIGCALSFVSCWHLLAENSTAVTGTVPKHNCRVYHLPWQTKDGAGEGCLRGMLDNRLGACEAISPSDQQSRAKGRSQNTHGCKDMSGTVQGALVCPVIHEPYAGQGPTLSSRSKTRLQGG